MSRAPKTFAWMSLGTGTVIALFVGWLLLSIGGSRTTLWVNDLAQVAAAWTAAVMCAVAAARHSGHRRAGWALLAGSAFSWGLGQVTWCWYELALGEPVPTPSLSDIGFLAAVPLALGAAVLLPGGLLRVSSRAATVLGGLVIAGGLLALSWVTVLETVYTAGGESRLAQVVNLAYPATDVLIGTMLVALVLRMPPGNRVAIGLVVIGLVGNAIADSSFAYLTAKGTYGSGNVLDAGWVGGYLFVALGAFRAAQRPERRQRAAKDIPPYWRATVTFAPPALALAIAVRQVVLAGHLEPLLFWVLATLFVLVGALQVITLVENHALVIRLQVDEAEMRHRAFHDPLTGLPNRALFFRRVDVALETARNGTVTAVMMIDVDDLKRVNDLHGHDAGDRLLTAFADRCRGALRPGDTAARLGGDEFGVLMEHLPDPEAAAAISARVIAVLNTSRVTIGTWSKGEPSSTLLQASGGVALSGPGEMSRRELVRRADFAMYRAKGLGKGRHVVYDGRLEPDPAPPRLPVASAG